MDIQKYKNRMHELKGQKESISSALEKEKEKHEILEQDYLDAELASDIIYEVAKSTQEGLSVKIEDMVSTALAYVMDDPYEFKLEWDISNNRPQCYPQFLRDGFVSDPFKDSSGTALDTASLAARLAVWSLPKDRTSPVFVLDENFKHVSAGMRDKASMFLKELCNKLGVQCITCTHIVQQIEGSDRTFRISKRGKESEVEIV